MGIEGTWALWNLLLSIGGVIVAITMGIKILVVGAKYDEYGEIESQGRLRMILCVPTSAVIAIIVFILTQDMRLPMVMTDWWTLLHAILFACGVIGYILSYRTVGDEEKRREQTAKMIREQIAKTIIENGLSVKTVGELLVIDANIINTWVQDYRRENNISSHAEARSMMTTPLTERELVLRVEELEREIEQKDKHLQEEKAKVEVLKETLHSFMQTQE